MAINYKPLKDSYVVFTKATTAMWAKMPDAQKLSNTLYFVVDGLEDTVGQLYLGNTLIADGSGLTTMGIEQLEDVDLVKALRSGDVLMYNISTDKWENVSLPSYIGDLIQPFIGATNDNDGTAGLVPAPVKTIDVNHYLQGNGTWSNPTEQVEKDISGLTATVNTLVGSDTGLSVREISTEIANDAANTAVARILDNAPDSFDTLKEIAEWINDHPQASDFATLQSKVGSLEDIINGTADTEGLKSVVNTLNIDINGENGLKARVDTLEGQAITFTQNINDLTSKYNTLNTTVFNHGEDIAAIYELLTWKELEVIL